MVQEVVWMIIIITGAYLIWILFQNMHFYENFENDSDIAHRIIRTYYYNLNRSPTTEELKRHTDAISTNEYSYDELELRIINSEEYQRLIKTQTDRILPETARIIEEKELIDRIVRIYKKVRTVECPEEMYLPLKDLYIYFDYNVYKFVALLRDSKYIEFEDMIKSDLKLSKESLIEKYLALFDDSKLNYDAAALEEMDKTLKKGNRISDLLLSTTNKVANSSSSNIDAFAMLSYFMKNINEEKEKAKKLEEEERLKNIKEATQELEKQQKMFVKQTVSPSPSQQNECTATQRLYLPEESKILNTEYGFRQIMKTPPICIPVGKPNDIPEIIIYNGLQGTNIEESMKNTQVGSILPKFEYVRYIDIDVPGSTKKPPPV